MILILKVTYVQIIIKYNAQNMKNKVLILKINKLVLVIFFIIAYHKEPLESGDERAVHKELP